MHGNLNAKVLTNSLNKCWFYKMHGTHCIKIHYSF
jgi:hypothetical protein